MTMIPVIDFTNGQRLLYRVSVIALFASFAIGFSAVIWREGRPPDFAMRHLQEIIALLGREDYSTALTRLRIATSIAPDDDSARYLLGVAQHRTGNLSEAKAAFQEVLKIKPWHPDAHFFLGLIHLEQHNLEAAVWHNTIAVKLRPANERAQTNLAVALLRQGKTAEAIEHLQAALRVHPGFPPAQQTLDQILGSKSVTAR